MAQFINIMTLHVNTYAFVLLKIIIKSYNYCLPILHSNDLYNINTTNTLYMLYIYYQVLCFFMQMFFFYAGCLVKSICLLK